MGILFIVLFPRDDDLGLLPVKILAARPFGIIAVRVILVGIVWDPVVGSLLPISLLRILVTYTTNEFGELAQS